MTDERRKKIEHDSEIDVGSPDDDRHYIRLGELRELLADSEALERVRAACEANDSGPDVFGHPGPLGRVLDIIKESPARKETP